MTSDRGISIGRLGECTGTNTPTIRYYEEIGLLRPPDRRANGHRTYGDADVRRLTLIRRCREFGFPIEQVRTLVGLLEDSDRSCLEGRELAHKHLASVRAKLAELKALEESVADFTKDFDTKCSGVPGPECVILGDLSRPRRRRSVRSAARRHTLATPAKA